MMPSHCSNHIKPNGHFWGFFRQCFWWWRLTSYAKVVDWRKSWSKPRKGQRCAALPHEDDVILVERWNKRRSLYILTSPFFFSVHKTFNSSGPFLFSLSQTKTHAIPATLISSQIIFLDLQKENVHLSCLWIKSTFLTPLPKKKLANNGSLSALYRFPAKSNTFLRVK